MKALQGKNTKKSGVLIIKFVDLNILSWDYDSLEINKKKWLSNNLDINHSKVPSSGNILEIQNIILFSIFPYRGVMMKTDYSRLQRDMAYRARFELLILLIPVEVRRINLIPIEFLSKSGGLYLKGVTGNVWKGWFWKKVFFKLLNNDDEKCNKNSTVN